MLEYEPIFDGALFERERACDSSATLLPLLCGCVALTFTAGFGAWVLSAPQVAAPQVLMVRSASEPLPARRVANPYGSLIAFAAAPAAAPPQRQANPYGELAELRPDSQTPPPAPPEFAEVAPLAPVAVAPVADASVVAAPAAAAPVAAAPAAPVIAAPAVPLPPERDVAREDAVAPLPPARPTEFAALAPAARNPPRPVQRAAVAAAAPVDDRNVFQKLFGVGRPAEPAESSLAYASPETTVRERSVAPDSALGSSIFSPRSAPPAGYDQNTAVYDISARTVYLPDGTRLEAHSGLGDYLDDPRHVDLRMRGATPPHLYALQPREELFHGVAALRLVPVGGDGSVYGRSGLLAHTFMLGPNGDSNGCVSFRDYDAFLKAFHEGKVTRLAVVAKL
jgi:hypothetical protein